MHITFNFSACARVALFTENTPRGILATVLGGIFTLLFSSLLAASTVEIRSDVLCPSAAEVSTRLQPLLPRGSTESTERHLATLNVVEQPDGRRALHLRLLRSDDSVIGDRHLFLAGDCQAMAESVAVVIAAWETEDPSALPDMPVVTEEKTAAPSPTMISPKIQLWGGVGAGAGFLNGTALVGNIEAQLGRSDSSWRLRLSVMREGDRRLGFESGHADWHHTMMTVGLVWQGTLGAWVGSLDAGPTLGWVTVKGVDFPNSQESQSLEYGVAGGTRVGLRLGRWTLWIEGRAQGWLRGQQALLSKSAKSAEMSRADVSASAGTTFLFF